MGLVGRKVWSVDVDGVRYGIYRIGDAYEPRATELASRRTWHLGQHASLCTQMEATIKVLEAALQAAKRSPLG